MASWKINVKTGIYEITRSDFLKPDFKFKEMKNYGKIEKAN